MKEERQYVAEAAAGDVPLIKIDNKTLARRGEVMRRRARARAAHATPR